MFALLRLFVELTSSLVLSGYVVVALLVLVRQANLPRARLLLSDGILLALNLGVVATLLGTVGLTTWSQIGLLVAVVLLRTGLKLAITRERRELRAGHG